MHPTDGENPREACEFIEQSKPTDIVLLCEHASNYIPDEYRRLGLAEADIERHIAWDIGAADLTRELAKRTGAPAFLATHSRLLIDLNRPLGSFDSIPLHSEDTAIPGNVDLASTEIELRQEQMFQPFHATVASFLNERQHDRNSVRLVAVHSFTPVYLGVARPWHAGVLSERARAFALDILGSLQAHSELNVTLDEPYAISRDSDYAVLMHGDDRDIDAVLLEIRNDLIRDPAGVKTWADLLCTALNSKSHSPRQNINVE